MLHNEFIVQNRAKYAWVNYQRVCARESVKKREAQFYMAQDTLDLIGMPEYKLKRLK